MKIRILFLLSTFFSVFCVQNLKTSDTEEGELNTGIGSITGTIEWVNVPSGEYTFERKDESRVIGYNYQIMKYSVTNAQYAAYLNAAHASEDMNATKTIVYGKFGGDQYWSAGKYQYIFLARSGSKISYNGNRFIVKSGFENHPVVEVSWFGANAFAKYYGFRLPTEEEWEKAARGNTGWDYPWGDKINGSRANYWNSGDPFDNGTTPVGYFNGSTHGSFKTTDSPSPYGAYDMAGNVSNWTDSYWTHTKRTHRLYRIVRGGSFHGIKSEIKCWGRGDLNPWQGYSQVGFRCVR